MRKSSFRRPLIKSLISWSRIINFRLYSMNLAWCFNFFCLCLLLFHTHSILWHLSFKLLPFLLYIQSLFLDISLRFWIISFNRNHSIIIFLLHSFNWSLIDLIIFGRDHPHTILDSQYLFFNLLYLYYHFLLCLTDPLLNDILCYHTLGLLLFC